MKSASSKFLLLAVSLSFCLFAWGCGGNDSTVTDDPSAGLGMEAEDCLPGEFYDPVDEACYLEPDCETDEECERLAQEYFGGLSGLDDEFTAGSQQFSDADIVQETKLISYDVQGDQLVNPAKETVADDLIGLRDDFDRHGELWQYFIRIVPDSYLGYVSGFEIFTDGRDGSLAAVYQDERNPDKWILAVDIADAYLDGNIDREDFSYSIVHEFGHLLTLNATQVPTDTELASAATDEDFSVLFERKSLACTPNFFVFEGCSNGDSYINGFYQRFWEDIYAEYDEIQFIEDEEEYSKATDAFYQKYSGRFANDYAATTPGEDIAESFTLFILKERPDGASVKDQKISFFYEYSELVKLRKLMRSRLVR